MAWARCYDLAKREMKDQVMSCFCVSGGTADNKKNWKNMTKRNKKLLICVYFEEIPVEGK